MPTKDAPRKMLTNSTGVVKTKHAMPPTHQIAATAPCTAQRRIIALMAWAMPMKKRMVAKKMGELTWWVNTAAATNRVVAVPIPFHTASMLRERTFSAPPAAFCRDFTTPLMAIATTTHIGHAQLLIGRKSVHVTAAK